MEILGGPLFGVAGAGESHGPAISTIIFGTPPGVYLRRDDIQAYLNRRRPGSNKHGTPRHEGDEVYLLAGLYQEEETLTNGPAIGLSAAGRPVTLPTYDAGYTTGEPLAAVVFSTATRSGDYAQFVGPAGEVRPGHADLVKYQQSRGYTDPRGGGRSSYRSTISDVIGGSVARLVLAGHFQTAIFSSIYRVGELETPHRLADKLNELTMNGRLVSPAEVQDLTAHLAAGEIYSDDHDFARAAGELIKQARLAGDSLGAAVEVVAVNVPALAGDPLYQSLKLRLMGTLGGLHAVQACELGDGLAVAGRRGSENNDPIRRPGYQSNHHGGLLGGVTTGRPVVARVSFKPTSTIARRQASVRKDLTEIDFELKSGRHDPCVGVRAGVTLESRLAIELLNAVLLHQSRQIEPAHFQLF